MDSAGWITTITLVLSVTSVILDRAVLDPHGSASATSSRPSASSAIEEQSAIKAAERVYEPLAQAAAELQSRIFNIVETGWVPLQKRYESHGDYAATSTAFLFAQYFGWIEARRQAVLTSSGEGGRDVSVQRAHRRGAQGAAPQRGQRGLPVLHDRAAGDRRAHADLGGASSETGTRIPNVAGYAAFVERYRNDEDFSPLVRARSTAGIDLVSKGDNRRLVAIQHALVAPHRRARPEAQVHRRLRPRSRSSSRSRSA